MYLAPLVENAETTNAFALAVGMNSLAGIRTLLREFDVRVRTVWGTGDKTFSPHSPAYLDHLFPGSKGGRLVPGAQLFFPEEYPEIIAEEARRLWEV